MGNPLFFHTGAPPKATHFPSRAAPRGSWPWVGRMMLRTLDVDDEEDADPAITTFFFPPDGGLEQPRRGGQVEIAQVVREAFPALIALVDAQPRTRGGILRDRLQKSTRLPGPGRHRQRPCVSRQHQVTA